MDDSGDPDANPEDYAAGAFGVSEACGGKCDNPNAILNVSATRLLANLEMVDYVSEEGEIETFSLTGARYLGRKRPRYGPHARSWSSEP